MFEETQVCYRAKDQTLLFDKVNGRGVDRFLVENYSLYTYTKALVMFLKSFETDNV